MDRTSPEYFETIERIVTYLKKGWKNYNIRRKLNISPFDFDIYIGDIKRKKIMTSEEIKAARAKKREEDLKFIADSINDGLSLTQIRELKPEFSYNEVTPMVKELITNGVVTQEQVEENQKNATRNTMNKEVELSPEEQVKFILDKVRKGYTPAEIVKSDKTKSLTMHKVLYQKRRLIAEGIITEEEADNAMRKRQENALKRKHKRIAKKIKEYTELGYTLVEISGFITEYNYGTLGDIKNAYAKENGWYTKEELESFAVLRKKREAEEAQRAFESLPPEEKERIIKEREAEAKRLEEEKRKRQEEIIVRRQARKAETNKKHQEDIDILKEHIKSGKTMERAAELMNCSLGYAYKIRRKSVQNGSWLTTEELALIQEQKRKEQEKARRKKERERKKEQERKREENQFRIKKEAFELLMYRKEGYTYKEISEKMNYSVPHLTVLKRLADKIFADKGDLEEFSQLIKFKEKKEQQQEQVRLKRELRQAKKEIKEQETVSKAFAKERKRKIKGYADAYKRYKKVAKAEDNLELDGEENVSTEGREKFIETLTALHSLEADISDKDIELVINAFDMHPEIADKASIKFLISDANKKGGLKSVGRIVNELSSTLRDTKFHKPLIEYGRWIKKIVLRPKIQEMKVQGMNNTQIGESLGISSAEVSIIFYNDKEPDFFDFDGR